jgi:hypothetical protein
MPNPMSRIDKGLLSSGTHLRGPGTGLRLPEAWMEARINSGTPERPDESGRGPFGRKKAPGDWYREGLLFQLPYRWVERAGCGPLR